MHTDAADHTLTRALWRNDCRTIDDARAVVTTIRRSVPACSDLHRAVIALGDDEAARSILRAAR